VNALQAAGAAAHSQKWLCHSLHTNYETSVRDVGVGHARSVEGKTGISVAIEKDEAASGVGASGENAHGLASG
jgi:hypothetical protein